MPLQDPQSVLVAFNKHIKHLIRGVQSDYPLRWNVILAQIQGRVLARRDLYTEVCSSLLDACALQKLPSELQRSVEICVEHDSNFKMHLASIVRDCLSKAIASAPSTGVWSLGISPIMLRNSRVHQLPCRQAQTSRIALSQQVNARAISSAKTVIPQEALITAESITIPTISEVLSREKTYPYPAKNYFPSYNLTKANTILEKQRQGAFLIRNSSQPGQCVLSYKASSTSVRHIRFRLGRDNKAVTIFGISREPTELLDIYHLLNSCSANLSSVNNSERRDSCRSESDSPSEGRQQLISSR